MRLSEVDTTYKAQGQRLSDVMSGVTKEPKEESPSLGIAAKLGGVPQLLDQDIEINTKQAQSLISRFGKQYYNVLAAQPVQAIGTQSQAALAKTDAAALRILKEDVKNRYESNQPLTIQEIEEYTKPYDKWSIGGLLKLKKPEWQQKLAADYKSGKVKILDRTKEEEIGRLQEALSIAQQEISEKVSIAAPVKEAETTGEKAVDVAAGVAGFTTQIAALRKVMPGMPEPLVWEVQNQMSGGLPGHGALMYGLFSVPGKVIPGKTLKAGAARLGTESALLAGLTALEGGDKVDILISAGIPIGLKALKVPGLIKNLEGKNPELAETISAQPDFYSEVSRTKKAPKSVPALLNKVTWKKRWGGRSVSNLKLKMNELLVEAHKVEAKNLPNKDVILDRLANQMDAIEKQLRNLKHLKRKSNKNLLKLAKKQGIEVPKNASRDTIIELLQGQNDIVPVRDGFIVRDLENPGNKWKRKKYKTIEEAQKDLLNQEINLTIPVEGTDAVIVAHNDGGKVEVAKDKSWITAQVGDEVNQIAKDSNTSSENIVGNIQLQEVGRKVRSRFPGKIKDQKSFKAWGEQVLDYLGLGDWGIKLKLVKKIPRKFDPTGRATGYADLDDPADLSRRKRGGTIYIKAPTGEILTEAAWTPTPGQAGHKGRKWGEATRHTQGYAKRDFMHEVGHFLEPGEYKKGGVEVHTPEHKSKVNSLVDKLFEIRRKVKPVSETFVRLSEPPKIEQIPKPQQNVFEVKGTGEIYIEPFAEAGADVGTKLIKKGEGTVVVKTGTGQELKPRPDLVRNTGESVESYLNRVGKPSIISRNSVPPDYKPLKKKYKRKGKTVEVRGKSAVAIFKDWEVKEYKPAKGEWENVIKPKEIKKRNAAAISYGKYLKEKGVPQEEINRMLKSKFKGKFRKPKFEPPKLTDEQWNGIAERIDQVYEGNTYSITNSQSGIDKIRAGDIPYESEMAKLRPILGDSTVNRMSEGFEKIRTHSPIAKAELFRDLWKIKFGLDIQAARQLSGIAVTHPRIYATAVKINAFAYGSKSQANKIKLQIEQNPTFRLAQEKYGINMLWTKPWKKSVSTKLEQYGNVSGTLVKSKSKILRSSGKLLQASERGANLGIDWALTRLVEQAEVNLDKLAKKNNWSQAQIDRWRLERGRDINALTKRFVAKSPKGQQVQAALNWLWLSPSWTISRPLSSYRAVKNLVSGMPGNRVFAAKTVAAHLGAMVALGTLGSWLAAKARLNNPNEEPTWQGTVDPTDSLFGKLRVGNEVFDFTSGDAAWYRLLARIGVSAYAKAKETVTGKMVTKVAGKPVRPAGEEVKKYLQSRETIILGLGKTLLTGKDWLGRPIESEPGLLPGFPGKASLTEIAKAITPEALISIIEAGAADGMWEDMLAGNPDKAIKDLVDNWPVPIIASLGGGTTSYKVSPYSTRADFRDIVAQESYKKDWNDLNPSQVRSLEKKYKTEFGNFESQIREWKVKNPPNIEAIKEEEKKSGDIVRKNLSAENQLKVRGTSLGLSRRPQNFYLNDERYNRYIELYTEKLEELLDRKDAPSQRIIDTYKTLAKNKAYSQLKREMK